MSEDKEVIQARMLNNISDEYDKTEGSFFYDATKPAAIELAGMSNNCEEILNKGFADTATGTYLDKICAEHGIYRKLATKSTSTVKILGNIGAKINKGDKVASDSVNFIFTEDKIIDSTGQAFAAVECETAGNIGNVPVGAIKYFPATLTGLSSVTNLDKIYNGYDTETDAALRERFYTKVKTPATSGNKYHYLNWAKEVTGVGDAKVVPLWNGNGTVKIVIIDSNKKAAGSELITAVKNYMEDNRPIGANVTVVSAAEKNIDIAAKILISSNTSLSEIKKDFQDAIGAYLKDNAFKDTSISYARIGSILLDIEGVVDYLNLRVNNDSVNIVLSDEEVPVLNSISLEV